MQVVNWVSVEGGHPFGGWERGRRIMATREICSFLHVPEMPTEGFEKDILKLQKRMKDRKDERRSNMRQNKLGQKASLFKKELRRLEWSVKDRETRKDKIL